MSNIVLLYGLIGSGKTRTCIDLAERLRSEPQNIGGILSKRVYQEGELVGYDCQDLSSGHIYPLARLHHLVCRPDWFNFRELKYAFSSSGFKKANCALIRSSCELNIPTIVFIDEFGRLENAGVGMYPGIVKVVESLKNGNNAIMVCRTDLVGTVEELLKGRAQDVFKCEPGVFEKLWNVIQEFISI